MADPLKLLRQYNMSKMEIVERDNQIIFDEFAFPKNVNTMFMCKTKRNSPKEYYTLECLYFLKNCAVIHPDYVRQAAAANVQAVRRPDRKEVLQYLSGKTDTSESIDNSAQLDIPPNQQLKRPHNQEAGEPEEKKPCIEEKQKKKKKRKARKNSLLTHVKS